MYKKGQQVQVIKEDGIIQKGDILEIVSNGPLYKTDKGWLYIVRRPKITDITSANCLMAESYFKYFPDRLSKKMLYEGLQHGDKVEILPLDGVSEDYHGKVGKIITIKEVYPNEFRYTVRFNDRNSRLSFPAKYLKKL